MSTAADMNRFLAEVEKKAFTMAQIAVKDIDTALDIVQDAMLTLAVKYVSKPQAQWRPLFYRILRNRITDFHRRHTLTRRIFAMFNKGKDEDDDFDYVESNPGRYSEEPHREFELAGARDELVDALTALPERQREAFMLRTWEGLSVADTASAMQCSQGSVKTHYSRAVHNMRKKLEDHWS